MSPTTFERCTNRDDPDLCDPAVRLAIQRIKKGDNRDFSNDVSKYIHLQYFCSKCENFTELTPTEYFCPSCGELVSSKSTQEDRTMKCPTCICLDKAP